jgi:predicted restriction endonuclease
LVASDIIEAGLALKELTIVRKARTRDVALQEIARLCDEPLVERRRILPQISTPRATVAPWIRAVLCTAYEGRCQICRFGFLRADGEFHFEIHHIDAEYGDSPTNLLLLCPNCHAMLTYARISDPIHKSGWLVGLTINDRQVRVRQAMLQQQLTLPDQVALAFLISAMQNVIIGSNR